jgi:hypothetical protein
MGNKSKRPGKPGKTSDLVVDTATSAPAMLAAMVHDAGGAISISFDVLAKVADELLLHVTTTPEGVRLWTTVKPIIRPQLEVPEGPAGIADLGGPGLGRPDVMLQDEPHETPEDERLHVEGRLNEVFREPEDSG